MLTSTDKMIYIAVLNFGMIAVENTRRSVKLFNKLKRATALPRFNFEFLVAPPSHGHYKTKRLQKKWCRLYGKPTIYKDCRVV